MTPTDIARCGLAVADVLDRAGNPNSSGIIRQLAGLVIDQAAQLDTRAPARTPGGCPVCGGLVTQPAAGRRRLYCSEDHRRQAQRDRRAAKCA